MVRHIRGVALGALAAFVLAITSAVALGDADDYGFGYGMGPGMMGYGGPGYGMGWGYGGGPDMGPGMMGYGGPGYGMGPGMMGPAYGYGMGPGMMGVGPLWMLNLSDEQRAKIAQIQDNVRKKNWAIMGQVLDEQSKLEQLYATDLPDPKKVGGVYDKISQLRRQMIENGVEARNQMLGVLTKEQRQQLQQFRSGSFGRRGPQGPYPGRGTGRGMMGGG